MVSSDSLQRIKGDSAVCHWTSKSEAKLVLGFKVTTQYLEQETFIQPSLQWLKLWSWTESQSWAVIQIQNLGNGPMHDKQMNSLGYENSVFWIRSADPVLILERKVSRTHISYRYHVEWNERTYFLVMAGKMLPMTDEERRKPTEKITKLFCSQTHRKGPELPFCRQFQDHF